MSRNIIIIISIAVILSGIYLFYSLSVFDSRGGETMPLFSTRRYDPYGTAAVKEYFEKSGKEVFVQESPYIYPDRKGVMFQIYPYSENSGFSGKPEGLSLQNLDDWIAAGNTLVHFSRGYTTIMKRFEIPLPEHPESIKSSAEAINKSMRKGKHPEKIPGKLVKAEFGKHKFKILLRTPLYFSAEKSERWTPLAFCKGKAVAGEATFGKGKIIVIGAPTPMLNNQIKDAENLLFAIWLSNSKEVLFDDWSHGIGFNNSMISLLHKFKLFPFIIQVIFVLILIIWNSRRIHNLNLKKPKRKRSCSEQVNVLAYLYERSFSDAVLLSRCKHEIKLRIDKLNRHLLKKKRTAPDSCSELKQAVTTINKLTEKAENLSKSSKNRQMKKTLVEAIDLSGKHIKEKKNV